MYRRIGDSDDFIGELWKVHLRVKEEGYIQVNTQYFAAYYIRFTSHYG
jgi:hypothetical protein